ncbi:MAG: adaptor protein MecA [Eubacterium sp.]|nr:adaptor protein MecA [Eubacterium sp.]
MRRERISKDKIKYILDQADLEERNIDVKELKHGSGKASALFDELMEMTRDVFELEDGPVPLMVEAIPTSKGGLVVYISKVENPDELDTRFSRFTGNGDLDPEDDPEDDFDPAMNGELEPMDPDMDDEVEDDEDWENLDELVKDDNQPGNGPDENGQMGPDGIQIQQGPEIRAEINIPKSSQINPQDIMSMIDNIVSGLADKVGAQAIVKGPKPPGSKPETRAPRGDEQDPFALYEFKDIQSVIQASKLVGMHYDSENVLYKNPVNNRFYLYLGKGRNTRDEFNQVCVIMNEFGTRCSASYASKEFFEEHTTKILDDALIQLEELD